MTTIRLHCAMPAECGKIIKDMRKYSSRSAEYQLGRRGLEHQISQHPFFGRFDYKREIAIRPGHRESVKIVLDNPDVSIFSCDLVPDRRLFEIEGHNVERWVSRVTAIHHFALPDGERRGCGRWTFVEGHDDGPLPRVFAAVTWDNSHGGRYKNTLEVRLDEDTLIGSVYEAMSRFLQLMYLAPERLQHIDAPRPKREEASSD